MRYLLLAVAGMILACLGLDMLLRCLPVNSGIRMANTSAESPHPRHRALQPYLYSIGWAMSNVQRGVTNRQGHPNSRDFEDGANGLVIGDSFVEGLMLPYAETVQGRLDAAVGKVYAAGRSGNGLADALVLARHYLPLTHARTVILFVEPHDLTDIDGPVGRGHSRFVAAGQGVSIEHVPYIESPLKERVLASALLRYAYYNLNATELFKPSAKGEAARQAGDVSRHRVRRDQALAYLMTELGSLRDRYGTRFVFLVDGDRDALYTGGKNRPNWPAGERPAMLQAARAAGFDVVDMQPAFAAHWNTYRERMDWLPLDGHWNKVAHRLAAEQLLPLLRPAQTDMQSAAPAIRAGVE